MSTSASRRTVTLRSTGEAVGVARYVRSTDDPEVAEVAVAVIDDWQGRGLGVRCSHG